MIRDAEAVRKHAAKKARREERKQKTYSQLPSSVGLRAGRKRKRGDKGKKATKAKKTKKGLFGIGGLTRSSEKSKTEVRRSENF